MIPQLVETMRERKADTGIVSAKASTFITAAWRQSSHVIESERTPCARMFAKVIGGPVYRFGGMMPRA